MIASLAAVNVRLVLAYRGLVRGPLMDDGTRFEGGGLASFDAESEQTADTSCQTARSKCQAFHWSLPEKTSMLSNRSDGAQGRN